MSDASASPTPTGSADEIDRPLESTASVTGATEALHEEPSPAATLPPGSARRQLLAAYAAAGAKVISWVIAAAVVYRMMGVGPFAVFMLVRGTMALLNHTSFGLGPAVLHFAVHADRRSDHAVAAEVVEAAVADSPESRAGSTLAYAGPRTTADADTPTILVAPGEASANVLYHAFWLTALLCLFGVLGLAWYDAHFRQLHALPIGVVRSDLDAVWLLGLGVLARAVGDVAGGASQARGWFTLDQACAAACDLLWAVACLAAVAFDGPVLFLADIAMPFCITGLLAAASRWTLAGAAVAAFTFRRSAVRYRQQFSIGFYARLLAFGGLVTVGSVADFLYAPIAYVILNKLVDPLAVADYAPAVQIDAALILLVTAIAAVILPRAAIRYAGQDRAGVWREYVRGSLAAAGVTFVAAVAAWAVSPWLFEAWLGDPLPKTQAILPLVLVHTVLGSSGGVGRSTLLAVGRAGAYAASVLIGGLLNVGLSLAFVYAGWGIKGVIFGTILSVAARCLIWMPWFVRRSVLHAPPAVAAV